MSFHAPKGFMANHPVLGMGYGNNGYFKIMVEGTLLHVLASDGEGWEHVSVSLSKNRCPTWKEMCFIKDLFWDKQDCVVQYHPPESQYVNNVENCLHLWRPIGVDIPMPKSCMVGVK